MAIKLIADGGSTKTEWCLLDGKSKKKILTQGMSPYFVSSAQIQVIIEKELKPKLKNVIPDEVYFYGTGCSNATNVKIVKKAISQNFPGAVIYVDHDLSGAAKALCGKEKVLPVYWVQVQTPVIITAKK